MQIKRKMTLASQRPSYADVAKTPVKQNTSQSTNEKSCVKVVVRVRPENNREKDGTFDNVVRVMNENVLVFDPQEQSSPQYGYKNRRRRDVRIRKRKDLKFAFDYVFGPNSKNVDVYQQTTKQILNELVEGYNCSVFAYGATGAGKTHTMLGNPSQPGVMFLTMVDLYQRIAVIQDEKTCDVAMSYLEVYNEQINDLLMGGKALPVRENASSGIVIHGLSLHKPASAEELLHMLQYGNEKRTQHPTDANAESSRSHAVLQIFVRQRDRTANISTEVRVAKLCMVDLAGSERATVTKNQGKRFREGANINRSLLALGNVINALADSKFKGHVPYRDSKLTRILKDSLGGNCKTVMIAAVSPSSMTFEDTYNTLKYADRAKHIEAQLKKNVLNVDFHISRYQHIVEELRTEIVELKGKVQMYEEGKITSGRMQMTGSEEVARLKEKLDGIYCQRLEFTSKLLEADLKCRDLKWKVMRKEKCLSRPTLVCDNQSIKYTERLKKVIHSSRTKIEDFENMKKECSRKIEGNVKTFQQFWDRYHGKDIAEDQTQETIKLCHELHQTKLELTESEYKVKHLSKVVRYQEKEIVTSERLVLNLLVLLKKLKEQINLTSEQEAELRGVQKLVEGREVSFADQEIKCQSQSNYDLAELLNFSSYTCNNALGSSTSTQAILKNTQPIKDCNMENTCNGGATRVLSSERVSTTRISCVPQKSQVTASHDSSYIQSEQILTESNKNSLLQQFEQNVGDKTYCLVNASNTPSVSTPLLEQSVKLNSQPCDTCKLYSCICRNEVPLTEEPCSLCKLFSCTCTDSQKRYAGFTPGYKGKQNLLKSAILRHSNVTSVPNVQNVSYSTQNVTNDNESSEELNSTFTLEESKISDPQVRARTPVIHEKFSRKRLHSLPSDLQENFEEQFQRLSESPIDLCGPHNDNHGNTNSSLDSTFSVDDDSQNNKTQNIKSSATITKSRPSVLNDASKNTKAVKLCGSSTVTKGKETTFLVRGDEENIAPHSKIGDAADLKWESSPLDVENKSTCIRGLHFEESKSPVKARTWADVVMTPPSQSSAKRAPLRQVNVNTTPLAQPLEAGKERSKENIKKLQQFGLPSVYNKANINVNKPSYMQPTKAVRNRAKSSSTFSRSSSAHRGFLSSNANRPGWQL